MNATVCPECGIQAALNDQPDRTGRRVCDQCYVPTREALASDAATSDVTVVTPSVHTAGGEAPTCRKCGKPIANDQQGTFSPNLPGPAAARWSHNVCPA